MWKIPSLIRLLRLQAIYVGVAVVVAAFFWAINEPMHKAMMATGIVYAICVGNLIVPLLKRIHPSCSKRSYPYNWLFFLASLATLTPLLYVISSVVVWRFAPPSPQTLGHLIRTGWKLPCLAIVVCVVISVLYTETKERLERRNIELRRAVDQSAEKIEQQEKELERAREIQESLLPKQIPQVEGFEIATAWHPARAVGGDYFDVLRLDNNRLAVCIADVVGKGVSAALLMANVQATVRAFATASESPAAVCDHVNGVLCENIATGKFVTFFYGVIDAEKRSFQYCDAGHPYPILMSSNRAQQLRSGGAVLGVFPDWKYADSTVALNSGDKLLLFTDGITEACDADGEQFGEDKLAALIQTQNGVPASEMNRRVLAQVSEFCNGHFQDDATLVVIGCY